MKLATACVPCLDRRPHKRPLSSCPHSDLGILKSPYQCVVFIRASQIFLRVVPLRTHIFIEKEHSMAAATILSPGSCARKIVITSSVWIPRVILLAVVMVAVRVAKECVHCISAQYSSHYLKYFDPDASQTITRKTSDWCGHCTYWFKGEGAKRKQ